MLPLLVIISNAETYITQLDNVGMVVSHQNFNLFMRISFMRLNYLKTFCDRYPQNVHSLHMTIITSRINHYTTADTKHQQHTSAVLSTVSMNIIINLDSQYIN